MTQEIAVKIESRQIKLIHIAKSQLKISENHYRDMLSGFGVTTCKDLNEKQANELIELFKALGFKVFIKDEFRQYSHGIGRKKYDELKNRSDHYAIPSQLRKIEVLWRKYSDDKTNASLEKFLQNKNYGTNILAVQQKDVKKIVKAIKSFRGSKSSVQHSGV